MKLSININDNSENRVFFVIAMVFVIGFVLGNYSVIV